MPRYDSSHSFPSHRVQQRTDAAPRACPFSLSTRRWPTGTGTGPGSVSSAGPTAKAPFSFPRGNQCVDPKLSGVLPEWAPLSGSPLPGFYPARAGRPPHTLSMHWSRAALWAWVCGLRPVLLVARPMFSLCLFALARPPPAVCVTPLADISTKERPTPVL